MTALEQRPPDQLQVVVSQVRSDIFRQQIADALPDTVTPDKFVRVTITALRENPDLASCDQNTLFASIVKCAQDGLYPDGRDAALVTFKGKDGVKRVSYIPMIGGYRKIAAEHGWAIRTEVVYANDEFEHELGLDTKLVHRPPRPGVDRGERIAAYAVGVHRDGRKEFEVMDAAEIERVRQVSRAKDRGPWVDWTDRMWEKSAGRRLFAKLPLDTTDKERIERVLQADIEPAAASTMLYGPEGTRALHTGTPPEAAADAVTETSPTGGGGGQQVEGPAAETAAARTPSPAAGPESAGPSTPDDDPEPVEGDIVDSDAIAAAGAVAVPDGTHAGKPLSEVTDAIWLKWALRQSRYSGEFHDALETWVRANRSEIAAWYDRWVAAGSPAGEAWAEWSKAASA